MSALYIGELLHREQRGIEKTCIEQRDRYESNNSIYRAEIMVARMTAKAMTS